MAGGHGDRHPQKPLKITNGPTEEILLLHSFLNKEPLSFMLSSHVETSFVISTMERTKNNTRAFYFEGYRKKVKSSKREPVHGFYNLDTKKGLISA